MKLGRRVRRTRKGEYELNLPAEERELLRSLPRQLRDMLADTSDPSLRRLFPPAYPDDPEREADYRRLMADDLIARHRGYADTVAATVDERRLDEEQMLGWLGALNDLRLVLGTRLDVSEDQPAVPPDDPRAPAYALYGYLSWLQDQVVEALAGGM